MSWNDSKLKLPPMEKMVLCHIPSGYNGRSTYNFGMRIDAGDGDWLWAMADWGGIYYEDENPSVSSDDDYNVTHWMELPEPPGEYSTCPKCYTVMPVGEIEKHECA